MRKLLLFLLVATCLRAATVTVPFFTLKQGNITVTVTVAADNVTLVVSAITITSNAPAGSCVATLTDNSVPRTATVTTTGTQTVTFTIPVPQRTVKLANLQGDLADPYEAHASCAWK